jgi:hypothetical protein
VNIFDRIKKEDANARSTRLGAGLAIGIGVGLAIGAGMGNPGAGLVIGIALGVAFGASGQNKKASEPDGAPSASRDTVDRDTDEDAQPK